MVGDKKLLRLGEWLEANISLYTAMRTVYAPGDDLYGGSAAQISFRKEMIPVIEPSRLVQMFRDYDKYLDDHFVL